MDSQNRLYSLEGPRKNTNDALEKQIQVYLREIFRLRSAQNSNVPIFALPVELLAQVFLYIVDLSIYYNDTRFGAGTFGFRLVCRHWNEVAIGFPQLWTWWTSDNIKLWHLFKSRSKDAPLFLTWRYHRPSLQDVFKDPALPVRIRQLDFTGGSKELDSLLDALNSGPLTNLSSIRLRFSHFRYEGETRDHFAGFLPFSFPKLSKLDMEQCQPDSSSPLFTTSNLTSLKLHFHYCSSTPRFTLAQLSKILQRHPNLQELDLRAGTISRVGSPEVLVPVILPQLVDLRLHGTAQCISGFVNVIDMSSPLYNVVLHFDRPCDLHVPTFVNAVKEILAAYYECEGLDYPRKANSLTISSRPGGCYGPPSFVARSPPTPVSTPQSNLELEFEREFDGDEVFELLSLFPLNNVQELFVNGLDLASMDYRMLLRRMEGLTHLKLRALDIAPILEEMNSCDQGSSEEATEILHRMTYTWIVGPTGQTVPKLVSLTLSRIDLLRGVGGELLAFLERRYNQDIGLKHLVVESCRVHTAEEEVNSKEYVDKVEWIKPKEVGFYFESEEPDSDHRLSQYTRAFDSDSD